MLKTLFIGLAGLAGTLGRYWISDLFTRQYGETFPRGTMAVNLAGCFLAGAVFYLTEERLVFSPAARSVILIGFLGGFTTFSSYGLQTFELLREGQLGLATLNIGLSNLFGLLMVWVGYAIARAFWLW